MLLAGTAFFVPHPGHSAVPVKRSASHTITRAAQQTPSEPVPELVPTVTTSETFRLTPEHAFDEFIQEAGAKYSVDADLVRAVIRTESAFDPNAVSGAGAQGLMQLMPALSDELGVEDPFDPRQNIMAGTRYLGALLAYHGGNVPLALASYNAGPGAVARYQGIPPFDETRRYVKTIVGLLEQP